MKLSTSGIDRYLTIAGEGACATVIDMVVNRRK